MSQDSISIQTLFQKNQGQGNNNYNWVGVLEFLHEQHKQLQYKECEWALEKSQMQSKINELDGVIKGLERVVGDLGKRCKMLEVALRQERLKYQGQAPEYLNQILKDNTNQQQLQNYSTIPKRKAKPYRPLLQKIMQEVGIQSIFSPPSSPKLEHSNRPSVMLTPNQNVSQIIQNSGRQSPTNMNSTSGFPTHNRTKSQIHDDPTNKDPLQLSTTLRSHLDGIRDVFFFTNQPIVASASEDCQIKLWDLTNISEYMEPYLSLRDHTGPIFTMTGVDSRLRGNQNMIISAGSEGAIKQWNLPSPDDIGPYSHSEDVQPLKVSWQAHSDVIWQLAVNSQQNLLLSSAADGVVKLWPISDNSNEPRQLYVFGQKNQYGHFVDSPTSVCWLQHNQNYFASGFVNSPIIAIYDVESGKSVTTIKYANDMNAFLNQLSCYNTQTQIIGAHDDGKVRIFDLNTSKVAQSLIMSNSPITSAIVNLQGNYIIAANECLIKVWDVRKMQNILELEAHQKKYDEGIHKLVHHPSYNIVASAGADGLIKLFSEK